MAKKDSAATEAAKILGSKGGSTTRERYGHEFYVEIGKKGGSKVRDLIAAGREALRKKR